jgi:hypothetical protein
MDADKAELARLAGEAYIARHRAAGLCFRCPSAAVPGKTLCATCAAEQSAYAKGRRAITNARQRAVRAERRQVNVCTDCASPVTEGHVKCLRHVETDRVRQVRLGTPRRVAADRSTCLWCRLPNKPGRAMCENHLAQARVNKARYRARRAAGEPKRKYIQRGLFIGPIQRRNYRRPGEFPKKTVTVVRVVTVVPTVAVAPMCECGKRQIMRGGSLCFGCAVLQRRAA